MSIRTIQEKGKRYNIADVFYEVADKTPDQIAFKASGGKGKSYSYREVKELIQKTAALISSEYSDLKEIGLLSENRPEWGIAYLAIAATGKTVVPIDSNLKEKEIDYIVTHAGLKTIFTSVRFESLLSERHPGINVLSFNEGSPNFWIDENKTDNRYEVDNTNPVAVLIYTSGTTGSPKAVELTHKNLISNLNGIHNHFHFSPKDIFLSILPLHHTFEATCGFLTPLMVGSTIVYARSLKSNEIKEDIFNNNISIMIGVPLLFEKIYHTIIRKIDAAPVTKKILFKFLMMASKTGWKLGKRWGRPLFKSMRDKSGMGSIRMFVSGGAALPPHICRFYNFLGYEFFQGYGMTETSPVLTAQRPGDITFGTVGFPIEGVEVKIGDPDKFGVGEVIVRGDNITPGYRNNPEATAELIKDGWLYTGDLGKFEDGELWITGRKKNLIVSAAGKNIYPEQIEEKLLESNLILESVVIGRLNRNNQGEEVAAIIVPDLDHMKAVIVPDLDHMKAVKGIELDNPDKDKIHEIIKTEVARINASMSDYKRIKSFEIQLEELEKTSTKKIKRFLYK